MCEMPDVTSKLPGGPPNPSVQIYKNHSEIHSKKSENVVKSTLGPLVRLNLHTLVRTRTTARTLTPAQPRLMIRTRGRGLGGPFY